jgi:hypothetical protein
MKGFGHDRSGVQREKLGAVAAFVRHGSFQLSSFAGFGHHQAYLFAGEMFAKESVIQRSGPVQ